MHSSKISLNSTSKILFISLKIDREYFYDIENGKKTVEGRVLKDKYKKINIDSIIKFVNRGDEKEKILCKVTKIEKFENFAEMINNVGIKKLLPSISLGERGVEIYRSFGNYRNEEKEFDVVAFFLEKVG
jgi:ASC-1-like (ASCH) protein